MPELKSLLLGSIPQALHHLAKERTTYFRILSIQKQQTSMKVLVFREVFKEV